MPVECGNICAAADAQIRPVLLQDYFGTGLRYYFVAGAEIVPQKGVCNRNKISTWVTIFCEFLTRCGHMWSYMHMDSTISPPRPTAWCRWGGSGGGSNSVDVGRGDDNGSGNSYGNGDSGSGDGDSGDEDSNSDSIGGDSNSGKKNNNQLKAAVEKEATMAAGVRGERRQGRRERLERRASRKKMQTGARLVLVTRREHTKEIVPQIVPK